jgi:hypothetical protein
MSLEATYGQLTLSIKNGRFYGVSELPARKKGTAVINKAAIKGSVGWSKQASLFRVKLPIERKVRK